MLTLITCLFGCKKKEDVNSTAPSAVELETTQQETEDEAMEPLPELPTDEEELAKMIQSEEGYEPEDLDNLTEDYFAPETYCDTGMNTYMYFTNTEVLYGDDFLPMEAIGILIPSAQEFLIDMGFGEANELQVISGSETKTAEKASFTFTMDAYPDQEITMIFYFNHGGFGFEFSEGGKSNGQ